MNRIVSTFFGILHNCRPSTQFSKISRQHCEHAQLFSSYLEIIRCHYWLDVDVLWRRVSNLSLLVFINNLDEEGATDFKIYSELHHVLAGLGVSINCLKILLI
jgi:hypothetical protein